ncbi:MAG: hypothetical protein HOQ24_07310 [Mycobacteriaceae bacterium]|nr:hypothetical protein [Mycobacteriaceae bacterium]
MESPVLTEEVTDDDIERLLGGVSPALRSSIRRQMASALHAHPAAFQAFIDYQ